VNGRVFLAVLLVCAGLSTVHADGPQEYRVAAIIFAAHESKALIEDASGTQAWYKAGDNLGQANIVGIAVDSVTISGSDGRSMLMLRGSKRVAKADRDEVLALATEVSKEYQYVGLLSEIKASEARQGESQAAADSRTMNRVFGLADKAQITAIGRVEVSTAAEARAELQQRLLSSDPIRIAIEGDELKVLYVTPN
jgi:hypothetical protein